MSPYYGIILHRVAQTYIWIATTPLLYTKHWKILLLKHFLLIIEPPKMDQTSRELAKREIDESLKLSTFCMRRIGINFDKPKSTSSYLIQQVIFILSALCICYHVFSEAVNIGLTFFNSPRVEDVVPLFHTFGYGALSKLLILFIVINSF